MEPSTRRSPRQNSGRLIGTREPRESEQGSKDRRAQELARRHEVADDSHESIEQPRVGGDRACELEEAPLPVRQARRRLLGEFDERTTAAYASRTWGELRKLTEDLPAQPVLSSDVPGRPLPAPTLPALPPPARTHFRLGT